MDLLELLGLDEIEDYEGWCNDVKAAWPIYNDGQVAAIEQATAETAQWKDKYEEAAAKNYELIMAETGKTEEVESTEEEPEEEKSLEEIVQENLKERD